MKYMKEIIIKIPEDKYDRLMSQMKLDRNFSECEITELPKEHGKLIDADTYIADIRKHYFDNKTVIRCSEIVLDNIKPIIEATKGE